MFRTILTNNYKQSILIFIVLSACVNPFAPKLTDQDANSKLILTEQKSPEDVLTNFSFAYTFKDSLVYSDVLDSSFLFLSKDYSTDPVTNLSWGRDIDIKTTIGMFRHFQSLNLVWDRTSSKVYRNEDSSIVELAQNFQLTLDGGNEIPTINGIAKFIFIKKNSGIWKITRWEDESTF